jgi:hypothetical protein
MAVQGKGSAGALLTSYKSTEDCTYWFCAGPSKAAGASRALVAACAYTDLWLDDMLQAFSKSACCSMTGSSAPELERAVHSQPLPGAEQHASSRARRLPPPPPPSPFALPDVQSQVRLSLPHYCHQPTVSLTTATNPLSACSTAGPAARTCAGQPAQRASQAGGSAAPPQAWPCFGSPYTLQTRQGFPPAATW